MRQNVILGIPFIQLIQPFTITNEGIQTQTLKNKITFNFISRPQTRNINTLQDHSISEINCLIKDKENQLQFLREDLDYKRIEKNLLEPKTKNKIESLYKTIQQKICSNT